MSSWVVIGILGCGLDLNDYFLMIFDEWWFVYEWWIYWLLNAGWWTMHHNRAPKNVGFLGFAPIFKGLRISRYFSINSHQQVVASHWKITRYAHKKVKDETYGTWARSWQFYLTFCGDGEFKWPQINGFKRDKPKGHFESPGLYFSKWNIHDSKVLVKRLFGPFIYMYITFLISRISSIYCTLIYIHVDHCRSISSTANYSHSWPLVGNSTRTLLEVNLATRFLHKPCFFAQTFLLVSSVFGGFRTKQRKYGGSDIAKKCPKKIGSVLANFALKKPEMCIFVRVVLFCNLSSSSTYTPPKHSCVFFPPQPDSLGKFTQRLLTI